MDSLGAHRMVLMTGLGGAGTGGGEFRVNLSRLVVEPHEPVLHREAEDGSPDGLGGGFEIVGPALVFPTHHSLAAMDDDARSAARQRVVPGLLEQAAIQPRLPGREIRPEFTWAIGAVRRVGRDLNDNKRSEKR